MTMQKALHRRDDIDRLYVPRKEGRRGLASIEDCVDTSTQELEDCIKKDKERLIAATNNSIGNIITNKKITKMKKQKWEEKQLYGYFKQ